MRSMSILPGLAKRRGLMAEVAHETYRCIECGYTLERIWRPGQQQHCPACGGIMLAADDLDEEDENERQEN